MIFTAIIHCQSHSAAEMNERCSARAGMAMRKGPRLRPSRSSPASSRPRSMPCWQRRGVAIFAVMITHTRRRQIIRSHRLATCSCLLLFAWPWRAVRIVELDKGPRWPGSDRLLLYDGTTSLRHRLPGSSMVVVLEPLRPRSQSQLRWTSQSRSRNTRAGGSKCGWAGVKARLLEARD